MKKQTKDQRAVELVRRGMSKTEAAREVGLSKSRMTSLCLAAGIPKGMTAAARQKQSTKARREWEEYRARMKLPDPAVVFTNYEQGMKPRQLMEKYDLTRGQVVGIVYRAKKARGLVK